ncbi:MAG: hypothetical protein KC502_21980, partial [Myxococcales bacterium]|nr:hypothetical protein [Myxococcales bacterium]
MSSSHAHCNSAGHSRTASPVAPSAMIAMLVVLAMGMSTSASAAVPNQVLYEGLLTSTGGPATDGQYELTVAIYAVNSGGKPVWKEGPVKVDVKGGRFHLRLGTQTPLSGKTLAALPQQWLGVTVGKDPELPRQRLAAVPFALTAGAASFPYAGSKTVGGPALDLACTGCVSISELKFDSDVNFGAHAIKAKNATFSGDVAAGTVTATAFMGDGSKLTGIKTPSGSCSKSGEVVRGIKADGTLDCVSFSGALPKDGIAGVSNGAVSNVFIDSFPGPSPNTPIPDNTGTEAVSNVQVPDVGTVRDLKVHVKVVNSDLSNVSIKLLPPDDKAKGWLLCDPCGKVDAKSMDRTWSVKAPPKSGDIKKWIGKSAKGAWTLKVLDSQFCVVQKPGNKALCDLSKNTDGRLVDWSVKVETLSNQKIHDPLGRVYARKATAKSESLAHGQTIAVDTKTGDPALVAQAWLYDAPKKRWLPAASGVESGASCSECGTGKDGDYKPTKSTSLTGKTYNFKDFIIPKGITVTVTGSSALVIYATGQVQIAGTLRLSGAVGTEVYQGYNSGKCYNGGAGGPGGSAGGQGCYGQNGKAGAGPGGGKGGYSSGYGSGGGGAGHATKGTTAQKGSSGQTPGAGGNSYAGISGGSLLGGSGGGAGGYGSAYNASGAGGGGGGGAVKITAPKVAVTGMIDARGGAGGRCRSNTDGGAGGGGSGGAIWLRGGNVSVQGGTVIATGGAGGDAMHTQSSNGGDGGAGSTGRIRIDSPASISGTTNPTFTQGGSTGLGISLHAFELT